MRDREYERPPILSRRGSGSAESMQRDLLAHWRSGTASLAWLGRERVSLSGAGLVSSASSCRVGWALTPIFAFGIAGQKLVYGRLGT